MRPPRRAGCRLAAFVIGLISARSQLFGRVGGSCGPRTVPIRRPAPPEHPDRGGIEQPVDFVKVVARPAGRTRVLLTGGVAVEVGNVAQDPVQNCSPAPPAARLGRGGGGRVAASSGPLRG